jgi:hypothetical protein
MLTYLRVRWWFALLYLQDCLNHSRSIDSVTFLHVEMLWFEGSVRVTLAVNWMAVVVFAAPSYLCSTLLSVLWPVRFWHSSEHILMYSCICRLKRRFDSISRLCTTLNSPLHIERCIASVNPFMRSNHVGRWARMPVFPRSGFDSNPPQSSWGRCDVASTGTFIPSRLQPWV